MVNLFIANTDNTWFDFLASEPALTEVNFWWPREMAFRAIQPGELLVFRLKSPRNKIGGFGIFSSHSLLPIQMAWETFGRANGVPSFDALRNAIANYRTNSAVGPNTNIGCTVLVEPVFSRPIYGLISLNLGRAVFNEGKSIQQATPKVLIYGTDFMTCRNHFC
jgi:hypothetical protein